MRSEINGQTTVLILAGGRGDRLDPLTRKRAKPAVSFGGVYRIIDFTLSNCLNSRLQPAYVLTQHNRESLHNYLDASSGRQVTCVPPATGSTYCGTADAVYQNLRLMDRRQSDHILILSADHIYKMDYSRLLQFHREMGAKVTVSSVEYPRHVGRQFGILEVDCDSRIVSFEEKPERPKPIPGSSGSCLASMGIYVFNYDTLRDALTRDAARLDSSHDFGKDIFPYLIRSHGTFAFCFREGPHGIAPYWRDVGTIDAYYTAQMELLLVNSDFDAYGDPRWPLQAFGSEDGRYPLLTTDIEESRAKESLVCAGARIDGRVVGSVISPDVRVEQSAEVRDSILMHGVRVGKGAHIRRAIVEEGAHIPENAQIGHDSGRDRSLFKVTDTGVVVVAADVRFPSSLHGIKTANASRPCGAFQEWPTRPCHRSAKVSD